MSKECKSITQCSISGFYAMVTSLALYRSLHVLVEADVLALGKRDSPQLLFVLHCDCLIVVIETNMLALPHWQSLQGLWACFVICNVHSCQRM